VPTERRFRRRRKQREEKTVAKKREISERPPFVPGTKKGASVCDRHKKERKKKGAVDLLTRNN